MPDAIKLKYWANEVLPELRENKENHDKHNPIIVTKYKPNKKFGLTPKEFMVRCIDKGKVIYSEIDSIPVHKS